MSDEKKKSGLGASRTIYFPMIGFLILASMLWDVVSGYLAGGEDAPSLLVLIVSIVVLGGGVIFTAFQTYRTYKAEYAEFEKKKAQLAAEEVPAIEEETE